MKTITICDKEYPIECNAFTQIQYKSFFKEGLVKDLQTIREYLIKQTVVSKQVDTLDLSEAEKISKISEYMNEDIDDFLIKVTRMAWMFIYTANNKIEDYETWLKSITKFKIDDDWIVEVTELAVDCFC